MNEDGTPARDPIAVDATTTYVTFQSDRLPLVRPLLLIRGGEIVADAIEPTLTVLVNGGYKDNKPIPGDPTELRTMEPGSSISNVIAASGQLPGAVQDGVAAAKHDPTNPGKPAKDPLDVLKKPTGGLTKSSPKPPTNTFDMKSGGKFSAGASNNNSSSPEGSKGPVRQIIGHINSALSGLANGQRHNEKNDSADTPPGPHSP